MMKQPFAVTRRTEKLINRQAEIIQVYDAIYHSLAVCQVLFILGPGGMGKSRLAEEVLWRGGNHRLRQQRGLGPMGDDDWSSHKTESGLMAVYADLIDLSDPHYNNRADLMQAVRDALVGEGDVSFNDYDRERSNYLEMLQVGADTRIIDAVAEEIEGNFIKDLRENGARHRLVLVLDTAEKLEFGTSKELIDIGILEAVDFAYNSVQWLVGLIQNGLLVNTTLILVGREAEGKEFFDTMRTAWASDSQPKEIQLAPFSPEDVQAYFQQLAFDWQQITLQDSQWKHIPEQLDYLAQNEDQWRVLWLYTGGQPVRLAMYADILLQGYRVPEPLKDNWNKAIHRVGTNDPITNTTDKLREAQLEIEKEFISLIFQEPGLDSQILKILVRTPRGLTHDQLVYLLFAPTDVDLEFWRSEMEKEERVKSAIERMLLLSIVKQRPHQRLGLQDEVYNIYTRHMRLDLLNKQDEIQERKGLYKKLHQWAQFQIRHYQRKKHEFQEKDELSLQLANPAQALKMDFPDLGKIERIRRTAIYEAIRSWHLEAIHYDILEDFVDHLNGVLLEITDRMYVGSHENEDWMILNEINRVLNDSNLLEFIELHPWISLEKNNESIETALRRVMRQQEYTQWLRRFVLRGRYEDALKYYDKLEAYIQSWPKGRERSSFLHTLSAHERLGWKLNCHILMGEDIPKAIHELDEMLEDLKCLAKKPQDEIAIPEKGENGFIGHPAEDRLKIIIGQLNKVAGYGCALLGNDSLAQEYYSNAIVLFRELKHPQEATVTNNLSRTLSDQGSPYARLVCLDGLRRRVELNGFDVAYAYSLNTLALIDNDSFRPDLAWQEAAQARAYFRRAENLRGEGLALLQLAEALRRLARQEIVVSTVVDKPETVYEKALEAVHRAESIFYKDVVEKIRQIEAYIEMGCVHRDLVRFYVKFPIEHELNYQDALDCFRSAMNLAKEEKILRYQIDTQVNIAWTHYYYSDLEATEKAIQQAEALFPYDSRIISGKELPPSKRNDMYVYYQWGKLSALRGRIEMERFRNCTDVIKKLYGSLSSKERINLVIKDAKAMETLRAGVKAFTLAAGYNWLFSSRSPIIRIVEGPLYEYLKKLNRYELEQFMNEYQSVVKDYKLKDKVFIDQLIVKCFGSVSSS